MNLKLSEITTLLCLAPALALAQIQPDDLPGLELWLRSDTGITTAGNGVFVSQWNDISGNNRHCTNPIGNNFMPGPENNVINGKPSVTFYGTNDFLDFPEVTNIRTVFWLVKEFSNATSSVPRNLLGHSSATHFRRGTSKQLWNPALASPNVLNGTTRINFSPVDGTQALVPTELSIISVVTAGNVSASSITADQLQYNRVWAGQFIELIVYSTALTPEETLQVENYLANRYTQPFYVSNDVNVDYGFCDTTIAAAPGFDSYLWSTGETTSSITINNTGDYWVEATDRFDRILRDTVHVQFPGFTSELSETICYGEVFSWNTGLSQDDYNLEWYDASTGSSHDFSEEGNYTLQVVDTSGCILNTTLELQVDSLSQYITLGPDQELCSGNEIQLLPHSYTNLSYEWSDNSNLDHLVVNETGDYWVKVTDENECETTDTIHVTIVGAAPGISFSIANPCAGGPTAFTGLNLSGSNISNWEWTFSDEGSNSGQNIEHTFPGTGDYSLNLVATTAEGCATSMDSAIYIYLLPVAGFTYSVPCDNAPIHFNDNSSSIEGEIISWQWNIDGAFINGDSISAMINETGFQPAQLTVTTEHGCVDEYEMLVDVKAAPGAGFSYSGQCLGMLSTFNEETDFSASGPIAGYNWSFGDGTTSNLADPSHYFTEDGTFHVQLITVAQTSCSDTITQVIEIHPAPAVDFIIINACLGQPFILQDMTSAPGDSLIQWNWTVENTGQFAEQNPVVIFNETGLHEVELSVLTETGCTGSIVQSIPVWEVPSPEFTFTPEIAQAPAEIVFTNQTTLGNEFSWDFGDSNLSTEINPVHTYATNGTYTIQLRAENASGCFDVITHNIIIDVPHMDILVEQVTCTPGANGTSITAIVVNAGNIKTEGLDLQWKLGNDSPVSEKWNGTLDPGNTVIFTFSSLMNITDAQFPYVCVTAVPSSTDHADENPSNNTFCKSLEDDGFELFPPYPNPGESAMFVRFTTPIEGDCILRIIDTSGKIWRDWIDNDVPKGFHEYFVNISNLADGNYIIDLTQDGRSLRQHFMKLSNK